VEAPVKAEAAATRVAKMASFMLIYISANTDEQECEYTPMTKRKFVRRATWSDSRYLF
jgi:hypothetical protein